MKHLQQMLRTVEWLYSVKQIGPITHWIWCTQIKNWGRDAYGMIW